MSKQLLLHCIFQGTSVGCRKARENIKVEVNCHPLFIRGHTSLIVMILHLVKQGLALSAHPLLVLNIPLLDFLLFITCEAHLIIETHEVEDSGYGFSSGIPESCSPGAKRVTRSIGCKKSRYNFADTPAFRKSSLAVIASYVAYAFSSWNPSHFTWVLNLSFLLLQQRVRMFGHNIVFFNYRCRLRAYATFFFSLS